MRTVTLVLAANFCAASATAAEREVIKTDWAGFRQEVSARKLNGRSVQIQLAGGSQVKTRLHSIDDTGVITSLSKATQAWKSTQDRALIPQREIRSVRFDGHTGKGALIGGLAGLGAGAGIAAALTMSADCSEGPCIILLPAIGVAVAVGTAFAGYFAGRGLSPLAPEFVLAP